MRTSLRVRTTTRGGAPKRSPPILKLFDACNSKKKPPSKTLARRIAHAIHVGAALVGAAGVARGPQPFALTDYIRRYTCNPLFAAAVFPTLLADIGSGLALTINSYLTNAACFADLRDHAVRLMKRRNGHG